MSPDQNPLASAVTRAEAEILADWMRLQKGMAGRRTDLIDDPTLAEQSRQLLGAVRDGLGTGSTDTASAAWAPAREFIARLAQERARVGFLARDAALFVLSLKQALLPRLLSGRDAQADARAVQDVTAAVDSLALLAIEEYQKQREAVISRQQQDLLELSTPVVQLWKNILALPLIGTLDSARTQIVMENLLQAIVDNGATIAIIDITGVPTVDTLVAQHLLKTVAAARLMGADCIISGIRPQIAQTIVHLGVDLADVTTKATLADAFSIALRRSGLTVTRVNPQ
jgi:rsbT co-antagonist protein RsbR